MADVKSEPSSAQAPNEETTSPQIQRTNDGSADASDKMESQQQTIDELSIGAPADATSPAEPALKGKDKEEPPPPPVEKTQTREDDSLSIGPPAISTSNNTAESTVCTITLLLPTGARHPYKIDERYLTKRGVDIPDVLESGKKDPFSISVYKLKELILREWREEWEGKPASPSSIRLIHFGKLLDDKEQLKKYQLSKDAPNVVHMSVRPAEMMEEDEGTKGGKTSSREGRSREGSGGCCVIL